MKINSITPHELLYQYVHVQEKKRTTFQMQQGSDQVELTGDAKSFSAALKAAREQMGASMVNEGRVEEIKAQIQAGTYFVPGIQVAEKMLGE